MPMYVVDNEGIIKPGLRSDIMRKAMESKSLLQHRGGIYVGTGETQDTMVDGVNYSNFKTIEIYPESPSANLVLVTNFSSMEKPLRFDSVLSLLTDHSIDLSKLNSSTANTGDVLMCKNNEICFSKISGSSIDDGSITVNKITNNFCSSETVWDTNNIIGIQMGQDQNNKIKVNSVTFDYQNLANKIDWTNVGDNVPVFIVSDEKILTII